MSWKAKSARAVLAAKTRAENRAKEAGIRGESKKILLVLDEQLLSDFDKWRNVANDLTVTGGIRRAMQQYIDHQKMVNRQAHKNCMQNHDCRVVIYFLQVSEFVFYA